MFFKSNLWMSYWQIHTCNIKAKNINHVASNYDTVDTVFIRIKNNKT